MPLRSSAFSRFVQFNGLEQLALVGHDASGADGVWWLLSTVFLDLARHGQRAVVIRCCHTNGVRLEWHLLKLVIPAKAGIQRLRWPGNVRSHWIPAVAGMTKNEVSTLTVSKCHSSRSRLAKMASATHLLFQAAIHSCSPAWLFWLRRQPCQERSPALIHGASH